MRKILIFAFLFCFAPFAFGQQHSFPAGRMSNIDIVVKSAVLNIKTARVKEVVVETVSADAENVKEKIYLFKEGRKLKAFFDDKNINTKAVINMTVPNNVEIDLEAYNAVVSIDGVQKDLEIESIDSKIKVRDFKGSLDLDARGSIVIAGGVFKEIEVKSVDSKMEFDLFSVPARYDYEFKGDGNIIIRQTKNSKRKIKIFSDNFSGNIEIKE